MQLCYYLLNSPYHKPILTLTSKRRRSSYLGISKMEDLPEQENKRSISNGNKKRNSYFMRKVTVNTKEKTITKSS